MIDQLQQWIEEAKIITIFRHENPDLDALGSQFGLKVWLQENYPEKKILACGLEGREGFELDTATDSEIENSLAIVLDTPILARVDDLRIQLANKKVKIDHHPQVEKFTDLEFVDVKKAATCEYVPFLLEKIKKGGLTQMSAEFFYQGLLTDTLSFKTNNMTPDTFEVAAILAKTGIDIAKVSRKVFDKSLEVFKFISFLRGKLQIVNEDVGYVVLTIDEIEKFNLHPNQARGFVSEFGAIKELKAWALFTQTEKNKDEYKGSLRSKEIDLISIANDYHGGGHKNACGVKGLTEKKIQELLLKIVSKC